MKYRTLGNSGIEVSEVGFGVWPLTTGWWGKTDDADEMLKTAFDSGITFYDTAPAYGDDGFGETILAPFLAEHRDEVVITTKCGYDIHAERPKEQRERPHNWSRESIIDQIDESLMRLGIDCIDLMQLHNVRIDAVQDDDLFQTLNEFVEAGKIRSYGVALGPAIGWVEEGLYSLENRNIDSLQTVYNALEQEPGRTFARHEACTSGNVSLISRVPHASDVLSGKVTRDSLEEMLRSGDHRSHRVRENMLDNFDKADNISWLWSNESGRTISQAAIAAILAEKTFACVLPTCLTTDEIREYAKASDLPLSDSEANALWEAYDNNFGHENRFEMPLKSSN
ncbi:MAG: aldo/keto reductase [Acidimicrobiia bacterium]